MILSCVTPLGLHNRKARLNHMSDNTPTFYYRANTKRSSRNLHRGLVLRASIGLVLLHRLRV
jgi:hypothetical protein